MIFVGLGNPGKKYEMTRHNLGFLVVRALASKHGLQFKEEPRFKAEVAKGQMEGWQIHLLLPLTYMNLSGQALRLYLDFFKMSSKEVAVVADDVDTPFGEVRLKLAGGSGGHNGLRSVEAGLGTKNYIRLKMGIGSKPAPESDLADYVLDNFSAEEKNALPQIIQEGVSALEWLLKENIEKAMGRINTKKEKKADSSIEGSGDKS